MASFWRSFWIVSFIVISVITAIIFALLMNLHEGNYFYSWLFDQSKFYTPRIYRSVYSLFTEKEICNQETKKLAVDYVIIGAGTAGSVIAHRLSQKNKTASILIIEAGSNKIGNIFTEIPGIAPLAWSNSYDNFSWDYRTEFQKNMLNRTFKWPAGKLLGGTSSINFMIYSQAMPEDYNTWSATSGCSNWQWDEVKDYFKEIEKKSTITIEPTKFGLLWQKAGDEPLSTPKVQEKVLRMFIKEGLRWGPAKEHLYQASLRPNVYVLTNTNVEKISLRTLSYEPRVHVTNGIRVRTEEDKKIDIVVREKVILSAGAIENVRILSNSFDAKEDFFPLIGKNMRDHLFVPMFFSIKDKEFGYSLSMWSMLKYGWNYLFSSTGPIAQTFRDGGSIYLNTKSNDFDAQKINFAPNLQLVMMSTVLNPSSLNAIFSKYLDEVSLSIYKEITEINKNSNGFSIFAILTRPESSGTIKFNTSFELNPNYLSNKDDVITMLKGIKFAQEFVFKTKSFQEIQISSIKPYYENSTFMKKCSMDEALKQLIDANFGKDVDFDANYWACYIKHVSYSMFHFFGTVQFGNQSLVLKSENSLTDCSLKFRSTENLYVADASVIPDAVSGGIQGATIMIAEKFVKETLK